MRVETGWVSVAMRSGGFFRGSLPGSLSSVGAKADSSSVGFWWCHELADGVEDDLELGVVFLLKRIELPGEVSMGVEHPAQPDEGTHELDVDLDGALAAKNAR